MDVLKLARNVKSTVSAFHTFMTRSLKKFDLTRERVDFLCNLYPCPVVPPLGFRSKQIVNVEISQAKNYCQN